MPPDEKSVLIFEAHSDDCAIGMGGTALRFANQGFRTILVTATKGETAFTDVAQEDSIAETRRAEGLQADIILKIATHEEMNLPCQGLKNSRENYQQVVSLIRKFRPTYIFTQNPDSSHRDHRALANLVEEVWWKATERVLADRGEPFRAEALFFYETTNMFPYPSTIIDITPFFEDKLRAVRVFQSQFDVLGDLEKYVTGMGLTRGYQGKCEYGEAFLASNFLPKSEF